MELTLVAPYPVPPNEHERLAALYAFDILDTDAEPAFDRIVNMAARLMNTPIGLVSLVDHHRQWFKAKCGLDATETSREFSFCTHAMLRDEPLVVCDATKDSRFYNNPLVTGDMSIRFYAGAPLRTTDGLGLGSLCVIDTVAREQPSQPQLTNLIDLAYLVSEQMEIRLADKARRGHENRLKEAQRIAHVGHWEWDVSAQSGFCSDETYRLFGLAPQSGISFERFQKMLLPVDRERVTRAIANCLETGEPFALTHQIVRSNGAVIHVEARGRLERDRSGRPGKIVGTLLDVTARVQADSLMRQSKEELEQRVAQRTALLEREIEGHKLTQALVSSQNQVLRKIAEGAPRDQIFQMLLGFGKSEADMTCTRAILLKTEDGQNLRCATEPAMPPSAREALRELPIRPEGTSSAQAAYYGRQVILCAPDQMDNPDVALLQQHLLARSFVSTPIFDSDKQVLGTVSFGCPAEQPTDYELRVQDACASLASVVLLRDREQLALQRWEQMFRHASWGMALASADTHKLLAVNPSYAAMLGYAEGELLGKPVFDVFGQSLMSLDIMAADCFSQHPNLSYESVWTMKSGQELPVMIDVVEIRDPQGKPLYWSANVVDITERQGAEAKLQRALSQAQVMADLAPQMVFSSQADGWVDYYNEKWSEYTGKGIKEAGGWNWASVVHPDDLEDTVADWTDCLSTGEPYQIEVRLRRAIDGVYRWHLARALPLRNAAGEISQWFGTVTDIHGQKTENERLEALVGARTAQLTRLLLEKETLLKEVHHRVKNNLQVISSLLRMHGERVRDPLVVEALADSRRRVLSMALIHEQLYGNQQMDAIDFCEYAQALVNELFSSYSWEGRKITSRMEAANVLLPIDQAIPCGLILNELVTNAMKHAYPNGASGEVLIELRELGTEVSVSVSDNGIGMPAGWNLKSKGSMGLRIVEMLAKQLGGELGVECALGTRFEVKFPKEIRG